MARLNRPRPTATLTMADLLARQANQERRERQERLMEQRLEDLDIASIQPSCAWENLRFILVAVQFSAQILGGAFDFSQHPNSYTLPKYFLTVSYHAFLIFHHVLVFVVNGWFGFKKRVNMTMELVSLMVQIHFFAIFVVIVLCGNENKFDMTPYYILRGLMLIIATLQVFLIVVVEYRFSNKKHNTSRSRARETLLLKGVNKNEGSSLATAAIVKPRARRGSKEGGRLLSKMMENLIVAVDDKVEFPKPLVVTPPKEKAAAAREPYFFRERLSPSDQTPEDVQRQRSTGAISKRGIYYTPPMTEDSVDSTAGEIREPRSSSADARSRRRLRSFERPEAAISAETKVQIDPHTLIRTYITTFLDTSECNDSFGEPVVESPLDSFEWEGQFEADCLGRPALITTRKTMTVTQMFTDKAPIVISTAEDNSFITVS